MGMLIRTASDVIRKGLDPTIPHSDLGSDGMLKATSFPEVPAAAVVSVSTTPIAIATPAEVIVPVAIPVVVAEPVKEEEIPMAVAVKEPTEEAPVAMVAVTPEVPVEALEVSAVASPAIEEKKPAKGGKGKTPKNQPQS